MDKTVVKEHIVLAAAKSFAQKGVKTVRMDDIKPSSRKYPYIDFRPEREIGNEVLAVEHLSKTCLLYTSPQ